MKSYVFCCCCCCSGMPYFWYTNKEVFHMNRPNKSPIQSGPKGQQFEVHYTGDLLRKRQIINPGSGTPTKPSWEPSLSYSLWKEVNFSLHPGVKNFQVIDCKAFPNLGLEGESKTTIPGHTSLLSEPSRLSWVLLHQIGTFLSDECLLPVYRCPVILTLALTLIKGKNPEFRITMATMRELFTCQNQ